MCKYLCRKKREYKYIKKLVSIETETCQRRIPRAYSNSSKASCMAIDERMTVPQYHHEKVHMIYCHCNIKCGSRPLPCLLFLRAILETQAPSGFPVAASFGPLGLQFLSA